MSRIHDALRKAEQERITSAGPEVGKPIEVVEIEVVPTEGQLRLPTAAIEGRPAPLTLDLLRARCARHPWTPDHKRILFFNNQSHLPGTEEFRTLRSRLYKMRDKLHLRTILVGSALPREGKTFVAANLAQVMVRQRERTALLIDGDLRRSQLHLSLGAPSSPGLTDYLLGEADELSVIQRGLTENLFFIPGGKAVNNPAELLANGRLQSLMERLAPIFDWVIVDTPPAVPVSDASLLARVCDGVLIVVHAGATPFDAAQKMRDEFRDKQLLGVILNRADPRAGYGVYYYHYRRKFKDESNRG